MAATKQPSRLGARLVTATPSWNLLLLLLQDAAWGGLAPWRLAGEHQCGTADGQDQPGAAAAAVFVEQRRSRCSTAMALGPGRVWAGSWRRGNPSRWASSTARPPRLPPRSAAALLAGVQIGAIIGRPRQPQEVALALTGPQSEHQRQRELGPCGLRGKRGAFSSRQNLLARSEA